MPKRPEKKLSWLLWFDFCPVSCHSIFIQEDSNHTSHFITNTNMGNNWTSFISFCSQISIQIVWINFSHQIHLCVLECLIIIILRTYIHLFVCLMKTTQLKCKLQCKCNLNVIAIYYLLVSWCIKQTWFSAFTGIFNRRPELKMRMVRMKDGTQSVGVPDWSKYLLFLLCTALYLKCTKRKVKYLPQNRFIFCSVSLSVDPPSSLM